MEIRRGTREIIQRVDKIGDLRACRVDVPVLSKISLSLSAIFAQAWCETVGYK